MKCQWTLQKFFKQDCISDVIMFIHTNSRPGCGEVWDLYGWKVLSHSGLFCKLTVIIDNVAVTGRKRSLFLPLFRPNFLTLQPYNFVNKQKNKYRKSWRSGCYLLLLWSTFGRRVKWSTSLSVEAPPVRLVCRWMAHGALIDSVLSQKILLERLKKRKRYWKIVCLVALAFNW